MSNINTLHKQKTGFTIVELLVIIVVIGILATLGVVGFGTWRKSVAQTETKSDLSQLSAAMTKVKGFSEGSSSGYPVFTTGTHFDGTGDTASVFKSSQNVQLTYVSGDKNGFCVDATSTAVDGVSYHLDTTQGTDPIEGTCAGGSDDETPPPGDGGDVTPPDDGDGGGGTPAPHWEVAALADLNGPRGMTIGSDGNLYVAGGNSHTVQKVTPAGSVTTYAGTGTQGLSNGNCASATFYGPQDVAIDNAGNMYVADGGSPLSIRKISSSCNVTTYKTGYSGYLEMNNAGTVMYVAADTGSGSCIKKITLSSGAVSDLAGNCSAYGNADGTGTAAKFNWTGDLTFDDSTGNLYMTDYGNSNIRKITSAGVVTTIAGQNTYDGAGLTGEVDGVGTAARFDHPDGIFLTSDGFLYVTDAWGQSIRKVTLGGTVTTLSCTANCTEQTGPLDQVWWYYPYNVQVGSDGTIYVLGYMGIKTIKWVE